MKNNYLVKFSNLVFAIALVVLTVSSVKAQYNLLPTDDVYIRNGNSTSFYQFDNFNSDTLLYVRQPTAHTDDKTNVERCTYIKFDLSSISENIVSAKLMLTVLRAVQNPNAGGLPRADFYLLDDDSWSENSLTWSDAPHTWDNPPDQYLFSYSFNIHNTDDPDTTYTFDVTQYVVSEADKVVSFFIADTLELESGTFIRFYSKESALESRRPVLMIETGGTAIEDDFVTVAERFSLSQNYPNPFNPETRITYSLKEDGYVEMAIYNLQGQKVRTLINQNVSKGVHHAIWNGLDQQNQLVSSGVYFCKLISNKKVSTIKMLLTR
jgi:hypothetical protein